MRDEGRHERRAEQKRLSNLSGDVGDRGLRKQGSLRRAPDGGEKTGERIREKEAKK